MHLRHGLSYRWPAICIRFFLRQRVTGEQSTQVIVLQLSSVDFCSKHWRQGLHLFQSALLTSTIIIITFVITVREFRAYSGNTETWKGNGQNPKCFISMLLSSNRGAAVSLVTSAHIPNNRAPCVKLSLISNLSVKKWGECQLFLENALQLFPRTAQVGCEVVFHFAKAISSNLAFKENCHWTLGSRFGSNPTG